MCSKCLYPQFHTIFSENYLKPQVRINKMVNKHTRAYSRNLGRHSILASVKFMVLRLLANTFVSQKIEYIPFCLCPQAKLSHKFLSSLPRKKEITPPKQPFLKMHFSPAERGKESIIELKKLPKFNLQGYWSQILINFSMIATFTFLISAFLCYNLASSMLKCEGSLT